MWAATCNSDSKCEYKCTARRVVSLQHIFEALRSPPNPEFVTKAIKFSYSKLIEYKKVKFKVIKFKRIKFKLVGLKTIK